MSINTFTELAAECTSLSGSVALVAQKVRDGKAISETDCIRFAGDIQIEEVLRQAALHLGGPAGLLRLVPGQELLIGSPIQALVATIHAVILGGTWNAMRARCLTGSPSSSSSKANSFTPELEFPTVLPSDWNSKGDEKFRFLYQFAWESKWPNAATLSEFVLRAGENPFLVPPMELKIKASDSALQLNFQSATSDKKSSDMLIPFADYILPSASQVQFPALVHPFVEPISGSDEPGWESVGGVVGNLQRLVKNIETFLEPVLIEEFGSKPNVTVESNVTGRRGPDPDSAGVRGAGLRDPRHVPRPPGPGYLDPRQPPGAGGDSGFGGPGGFGDDLLPGGGLGSGGMLFGPGHAGFDGGFAGRGGRVPPGRFGGPGPAPGVPPGARFDPYGPTIGGRGSGNPRPDHLKPPDDDFNDNIYF